MTRELLYFGSFNPVHNGHIALAEYAVERNLCDEVVLIVSPQSPYKEAAELAPEMDRFEMAERACAASKYPDRIKASAVEFLLPHPSYTVDTLHFLEKECGGRMRFAILMGGDQIAALDGWKEYERLFDYPIYVYPRRGERIDRFTDRITLLDDAPLLDISATDIRLRVAQGEPITGMVAPSVAEYIRKKGLWSPADLVAALTVQIEKTPDDRQLLLTRGKLHYRLNEWGRALNDFNRVLALDPAATEAAQYAGMIREILEFRYKDIYNP